MRLIEIHPGRHLRCEAFDEVTLHPGRIFFAFRARTVACREWCVRKPCDGGLSAEERIHAEGEYARLVGWLSCDEADVGLPEGFAARHGMSVERIFKFAELPKGPDSNCEATEPREVIAEIEKVFV